MKIKIDTTDKKITIEEEVNLKDFFDLLNKLFKEEEWKEFDLKMEKITVERWNDPITVLFNLTKPCIQPNTPQYPFDPIIYTSTDDSIDRMKEGTFNIECKLN